MTDYAIVFLAWGDKYLAEVEDCLDKSRHHIRHYDKILITDEKSDVTSLKSLVTNVVRADFRLNGLLRKTEIAGHLPIGYKGYLLLDSDTIVIGNISLGFEMADLHGVAIAPAPHYSLDVFLKFGRIMEMEMLQPMGQLQYNTGVIFFNTSEKVHSLFRKWEELAMKYQDPANDQPFFTLAMETTGFNPYTLSISYNYRGVGDAISGDVRIWHSHGSMPDNINEYDFPWPPRRAWPGRVDYPQRPDSTHKSKEKRSHAKLINRFMRMLGAR